MKMRKFSALAWNWSRSPSLQLLPLPSDWYLVHITQRYRISFNSWRFRSGSKNLEFYGIQNPSPFNRRLSLIRKHCQAILVFISFNIIRPSTTVYPKWSFIQWGSIGALFYPTNVASHLPSAHWTYETSMCNE
jgi:hypothetical protein